MNSMNIRYPSSNSESNSRCLEFIGVYILDENKKQLNGEKKLKDGTTVRFRNGLIDGNIYDSSGKIIAIQPAIEYPFGQEFWENGCPKGFPAISQNFGYYEEDWDKGKLVEIREEVVDKEVFIKLEQGEK